MAKKQVTKKEVTRVEKVEVKTIKQTTIPELKEACDIVSEMMQKYINENRGLYRVRAIQQAKSRIDKLIKEILIVK